MLIDRVFYNLTKFVSSFLTLGILVPLQAGLGNLGIYNRCPLPLQAVYDSGHLINREPDWSPTNSFGVILISRFLALTVERGGVTQLQV